MGPTRIETQSVYDHWEAVPRTPKKRRGKPNKRKVVVYTLLTLGFLTPAIWAVFLQGGPDHQPVGVLALASWLGLFTVFMSAGADDYVGAHRMTTGPKHRRVRTARGKHRVA